MFMAIFNNPKSQDGATSIEYAVIASLLSIVILGALLVISESSSDNYEGVAEKVSDAIEKSQSNDEPAEE